MPTASNTDDDPLISSAELAEYFRVDRGTVNRWLAAGLVPHIRTPTGRYKIRKSVADRLKKEGFTGK